MLIQFELRNNSVAFNQETHARTHARMHTAQCAYTNVRASVCMNINPWNYQVLCLHLYSTHTFTLNWIQLNWNWERGNIKPILHHHWQHNSLNNDSLCLWVSGSLSSILLLHIICVCVCNVNVYAIVVAFAAAAAATSSIQCSSIVCTRSVIGCIVCLFILHCTTQTDILYRIV